MDVGDDGRREIPGEDAVEMPAGEGVLALEEEGPRELEANAHEIGPIDQHGAECGDGFIQEAFSVCFRPAGLDSGLSRGKTPQEKAGRMFGMFLGKRPQLDESFVEPALTNQRSSV